MSTTRTITVLARGRQKSVESPYSDQEAVDRLAQRIVDGRESSSFANDLIRQGRSQLLSPKQVAWIHVLLVEGEAREATKDQPAPRFPGIAGLLATAREHGAKCPKLTYPAGTATSTGRIKLSTSGAQSSNPGRVHVTDGGAFGSNEYYGRLLEDGTLVSRQPIPEAVLALLQAIDAAPQAFSQLAGWLHGTCCYCGADLSTAESRGAGYGPICARKYGLPWGAETAAEAPTLRDIEVALRALPEAAQAALRPAGEQADDDDDGEPYEGEIQAERALGIR